MLSVPSCKWSRPLGGEYVDGAPYIYAVFIWCIPGALGKGGDDFGDTVSDLSWYFYLSTVIVYKNHITVMDATGGSIFRVDPKALGVQSAEAPGYCHGLYGCGICCASRITAVGNSLSAGPPVLPAGLRTGG